MTLDQRNGDIEPGGLVDGLDGLDDTQGSFQHGDGAATIGLVAAARGGGGRPSGRGRGVTEDGGLGEVPSQLGERDMGASR